MRRPLLQAASLFRPEDKNLSSEKTTKVQVYRLLSLLGAVLIFLFNPLLVPGGLETIDPMWPRLGIAGLFAALLVTSYGSKVVRRSYVAGMHALLYLLMAWVALVAAANRFSGIHGAWLLLMFAVLVAVVGFGANTIRPVLYFSGFGVLLTAGGAVLGPAPRTHPMVLLGSLAAVALAESIAIQRLLRAREKLREREEYERALREERGRFETLFENLPTPVVRCTAGEEETFFVDANTAFEEVFGMDTSAVEGEDVNELLVPEESQEEATEIDRRALKEGTQQREVRREVKDGPRDFQLQVAVREPEEGPQELYAIYTDITEQKRRARKLVEAKEKAERMNRLKSAFLANMSHEIRTPLASIVGFSEVLKERVQGELVEFTEKIFQSSQRLLKSIEAVLQLSRMEAGVMELEREPVRLGAVVEQAVETHGPRAQEQSVELKARVPDEAVEGLWNEEAIRRIIENLLENAIKFTPGGGQVKIRVRGEGPDAVLSVEDTGIGVSEKALPHIFEPFRQESEGQSRTYEGTGLGLSIVKHLTDLLGGEIDVESKKDEGTRFTVRLPRCTPDPHLE